MANPILPYFLSLASGIYLGENIDLPVIFLQIALASLLFLLIISLKVLSGRASLVISCLCVFLVGLLSLNPSIRQPTDPHHIIKHISREKTFYEGIIENISQLKHDDIALVVEMRKRISDGYSEEVTGRIILTVQNVDKLSDPLKYGDYIRFTTRLRQLKKYQNPGGYDHERLLNYQGIYARGVVRDPYSIIVLREGQGNYLRNKLEKIRRNLIDLIERNTEGIARTVVLAMTMGEHRTIPAETREMFSRTGTAHILAISGLHVGIIALLSSMLIKALLRRSEYLLLKFNITKLAIIASILPVIFYTFVAGGRVSVVRACIMIVTFMLAVVIDRERDFFNALFLAGLIILLATPYSLFDISFQLSFTAVGAIILINQVLPTKLAETLSALSYGRIIKPLVGLAIVNLSATAGTWPLVAHYFYLFSTVGLLANLIVVPLLGFIALPSCLMALMISPLCSPHYLFYLASWVINLTVSLIGFFDSLPYSSLLVVPPTRLQIFLYYALLFLGAVYLGYLNDKNKSKQRRWTKMGLAVVTVGILALIFFPRLKNFHQQELLLTAIDVGQGSSTLIELPKGKRILVDGGGSAYFEYDVGKNVVAPYLLHRKIKALDMIILTHPHSDHLDGLLYMVDKFKVCEVWTNGQSINTSAYRDLMETIKRKGIKHKIVSAASAPIFTNEVKLEVLNPPKPIGTTLGIDNFDEINNNSLVLKLTYGQIKILMAADIMSAAEERLVKCGYDLESHILLVPHHGSPASSTFGFVKAVRPQIAIISRGSDHMLPVGRTVARYLSVGALILRTDERGAITVRTDGNGISFSTFR